MAHPPTTLAPPSTAPDPLKRLLGALLLIPVAPLLVATWTSRRPIRLLHLYIWLLPPHVLFMTILFGFLNLPIGVVRAIAAWKELSLVAAFILATAMAVGQRSARLRLGLPDLFALGLLLQALVYALFPFEMYEESFGLTVQLYSLRDAVIFVLIYMVGRLTPATPRDARRILVSIGLMGVVTGILGVIDWAIIPSEAWARLGLVRYYNEFQGIFYNVDPGRNPLGLPENFWQFFGALQIRRAVSVYSQSQAFAVSYLIILPATLVLIYSSRSRRENWGWLGALGLALLGLGLSITRMTMLVCLIQLTLLGLMLRPLRRLTLTALVGLAVLTLVSLPVTAPMFIETFSLRDASSVHHLRAWSRSLDYLEDSPLIGHGLGSAGQTALRLQREDIGAESQYFKFTAELGLIGLSLYLGVTLATLATSFIGFRRDPDIDFRGVHAVVWVATIGVLLNMLTTNLYASVFILYVYWWLAGLSVQRRLVGPG